MRVISGKLKGFNLKTIKGLDTRPTTDRIKESIFNIITANIRNSYVLDLFAGTGGLGIEALSRGAKYCVFVDYNYNSIKIIKENLALTKLEQDAKVYKCTWNSYFKKYYDENVKYDIILLDPPYGKNIINSVLHEISKLNVLSDNGIILTESDVKDIIPDQVDKLYKTFSRKYGRTNINIYSKGEIEK